MKSGKSRVDVHFHFHGRLEEILPEELHLHFHGESALEPPVSGPPKEAPRRETAPTPKRLLVAHTMYQPILDYPTKVRAPSGSGPGVICSCGHVQFNESDPESVWAKIYNHDPGNVTTIPSDAVQGQVIQDGDPNYLFDHNALSNEVGGAHHSAGGASNFIRVWPVFASVGVKLPLTRRFFGITHRQTECQVGNPCAQFAPRAAFAQAEAGFPQRFRIQAGPPPPERKDETMAALASQFDAQVERCGREAGEGEMTWTSAAKRCQAADCVLWITRSGDSWQGTIVLRAIFGTKLDVPLVYRCAHWRVGAANVLLLDPWHKLAESLPSLTVTPV